MSYRFLFDLAIILISTKFLGLMTSRFQMPQVVGALIAGLVFGPSCLNILTETDFLSQLSELGVIVIMFSAGMGTNIQDLKNSGKAGFIVALCGVLVPLGAGTAVTWFFMHGQPDNTMLQNVFIGVILTATSVSITVETLKELGKLSTKVGNIILAAAIIDDILGLVALTIITSLAGTGVNVAFVLIKIVLFFVCAFFFGKIIVAGFNWYTTRIGRQKVRHRYAIFAFFVCLVYAFSAEEIFGVADIIGAFAAGLVIANTNKDRYIASKFKPMQYLFLTPVFFASIGIKMQLPELTTEVLLLSISIVAAAILSKMIGCGIGAKICGCSNKQSLRVGIGMVCRGEVALITANKGLALGLMPAAFFGPIVIMVVCCAILTPVLLKIAYRPQKEVVEPSDVMENALADKYSQMEDMDMLLDRLFASNWKYKDEHSDDAATSHAHQNS